LTKEPGKDYADYPKFTSETDFKPLGIPPEDKMKPYEDYRSLKEQKETKPTIKGDDTNE
jgi:hypothetical protein